MNRKYCRLIMGLVVLMLAGTVFSKELMLAASKDTFGRSNRRNRNSGASEQLLIAHVPNVRTLIAFDLSGITNEISGVQLQFRQHNSMPDKIDMVVAPMVNTSNNAAWSEGQGNLGTQGQNSRPGEACYAFSAFRDVPWESAAGDGLVDLADSMLWKSPVATVNGLGWEKGTWVRVPINDVALLEKTRKSKTPTITFGVWGKAGDGLYSISSNNSDWPAVLLLDLKEDKSK
ncbi:MAG: hypothetical protein DRP64_02365 [Verrucomicrobia bacterium]|nr:MAG: hypothetical protein DRP64_02365 [Verrucomicrobiota bacterium]